MVVDKLDKRFLSRMKEYLGDEFDEFLSHYENENCYKSVLINTTKCDENEVIKTLNLAKKSDFNENCYILDENEQENSKIKLNGNHPYHHAGALYFQENSASIVASLLPIEKGDFVLDCCAAPGGKSAGALNKLQNSGLLVANEFDKTRAKVLASNLERLGARNALVTNVSTDALKEHYSGFFDKVICDAPCSGEGMFLKEEAAITNYHFDLVNKCAFLQQKILENAACCLKENGILVYSTCTFAKEENEDIITNFLHSHADFELILATHKKARQSKFLAGTLRIYPMDGGEGHFVALLRRKSCIKANVKPYKKDNLKANNDLIKNFVAEYKSIFSDEIDEDDLFIFGNKLYLGKPLFNFDKLNVQKPFVECLNLEYKDKSGATKKHKSLNLSHNLFNSRDIKTVKELVNLNIDTCYNSYLQGFDCDLANMYNFSDGYKCVSVDKIALSFGKIVNTTLKNKYPKGLRIIHGNKKL